MSSIRGKRASADQKEVLLDFMENNLDFAHEKIQNRSGVNLMKQKWEELSANLNSTIGTTKSIEQWRQYWRDLKRNVKAKETNLKKAEGKIGPKGPIKLLNLIEKRVLAIISKDQTISNSRSDQLQVCDNSSTSKSFHTENSHISSTSISPVPSTSPILSTSPIPVKPLITSKTEFKSPITSIESTFAIPSTLAASSITSATSAIVAIPTTSIQHYSNVTKFVKKKAVRRLRPPSASFLIMKRFLNLEIQKFHFEVKKLKLAEKQLEIEEKKLNAVVKNTEMLDRFLDRVQMRFREN